MQKEYDVLRFIEYGHGCYVSSDNVKGCSLAEWVKNNPRMSKKNFMQWIHEIVRQLSQIHKLRGNPSYQYVNPYSIIVAEKGQICFLDIGAGSNLERVNMMNRENICQFFWPEHNMKSKDMYGLGKTIQYLLTFVKVEPELSRKEKNKLKRSIKKCIHQNAKRTYCTVTEVKRCLPDIQ